MDKLGSITIDNIVPSLRAELPDGFFVSMTQEEQEGTLLGLNPSAELDLSKNSAWIENLINLLDKKIEKNSKQHFAVRLVEKYGFTMTQENRDRLMIRTIPSYSNEKIRLNKDSLTESENEIASVKFWRYNHSASRRRSEGLEIQHEEGDTSCSSCKW